MTITFTLSSHSVSFSSLDLGQSFGLGSQCTIIQTIVKKIGLLNWRLLLVNLSIRNAWFLFKISTPETFLRSSAGLPRRFLRLRIVTNRIHMFFHFAKRLLDLVSRHYSMVLQGLSVSGIPNHLLLLVSDQSAFFFNFVDLNIFNVRSES